MEKHNGENQIKHPRLKKMVPELRRTINMDGIIIDCNEYYADKIGQSIDEIIGLHADEHTPPDDREKFHEEFEYWKKTKTGKKILINIMAKDGTIMEMISSIKSHIGEDGELTGRTAIMMDLNELKEFQKIVMLRKFESLYENSPDLYRTVNYNGTIVDCNKAYLRELGYDSKEDVVGMNLLEHTSEKSIDIMRINMANWRNTGAGKTSEIWMKRRDGTEFPSILTPTNIHDKDGNLIGRNVVIKDATSMYETKQMLSEQKKIDRMKEEFLSVVTHELKSPLTPIIGFAQALTRPKMLGELNEKQNDAVITILSNATRLRKLIGDMLDAHKLELKKMRFDLKEMSVNDLMSHIDKSFQLTAKEKGVSIHCNVKGNDEIMITSDRDRVEQVITNLTYNAIDFIPKDTGTVTVTAEYVGSEVQFSVVDNGIGIPPEKQKELFKKFYQANTSHDRKHGGTGLGLSICKGIVEGLGGKIGVESTENVGSNFYFILPVKRGDNESSPD
ncbi:MAG: PAS domain-containing sensor histidine kinase [Thaumarchaeota archaeon]|nr:PAS domain-containing sensor histidine kinase [Nitrososphaerota archaeon]